MLVCLFCMSHRNNSHYCHTWNHFFSICTTTGHQELIRTRIISRLTIFIFQNMIQPNLLSAGMLRTRTPDHCTSKEFSISYGPRDFRETSLFQLLSNLLVNSIAKVFHGALSTLKYHRGRVVRRLASWFGVHTDQIKCFPHFFDELVDVEPFVGGNGDTVRDLV